MYLKKYCNISNMKNKKELEQVSVVFYGAPLDIPLAEIEAGLIDDEVLHFAIKSYSKELALLNIETFKIDRNMIVTEEGYKLAYREEPVKIEQGE